MLFPRHLRKKNARYSETCPKRWFAKLLALGFRTHTHTPRIQRETEIDFMANVHLHLGAKLRKAMTRSWYQGYSNKLQHSCQIYNEVLRLLVAAVKLRNIHQEPEAYTCSQKQPSCHALSRNKLFVWGWGDALNLLGWKVGAYSNNFYLLLAIIMVYKVNCEPGRERLINADVFTIH